MPPEIVAIYELVASKGAELPFPVRVLLYKPVQSERMAPAWSCKVTVEPLWAKPFEIYGEGSFQALCLGAKHAVQMLAAFIEQGGVLEYGEGEAFDPEVFGFRLLPPSGEASDA
jgi:hypothetical protein